MIDGFTLDQLRTFIAAADTGSFSAAGRQLRRAQSVVSQTLANLEAQIGIRLFDRRGRYPVLTEAGRALLGEARVVTAGIDHFKAQARGLAEGLEPELAVTVDTMFPIAALTRAVAGFQSRFPATPLRLYVETLGAVVKPVLDGSCAFGVTGSLPILPPDLESERLLAIRMTIVCAPSHPLARRRKPAPARELAKHVQLVLTDRSDLTRGLEFGVLSPRTWRLADLGAKHAFLKAGLGFGAMPLGVIESDLAEGALVRISVEDSSPEGILMPMSAFWRSDRPPGPAGRWLVAELKEAIPRQTRR